MTPFQINIPDQSISDLQDRVRRTRWPGSIFQTGDEDGVSLERVRTLAEQWLDFDWRSAESELNKAPHFVESIDGMDVHFIYQKGVGPFPRPIVLTHGWPGSFLEFRRAIDLLTDPGAHGGDPGEAFDVVVPSLPGFGLSAAPSSPGFSAHRVAELWHKLMLRLGYTRYFAQGGDIGASVTAWLGFLYPDAVEGMHLNYIPGSFRPPLGQNYPPVSLDENEFLNRFSRFASAEGAYSLLQATKPQTLSFALSDSPIGL